MKKNKIRTKRAILHDLKRIAKTMNLVKNDCDEDIRKIEQKKVKIGLLADECDRLHEDVEYLLSNNNNKNEENK